MAKKSTGSSIDQIIAEKERQYIAEKERQYIARMERKHQSRQAEEERRHMNKMRRMYMEEISKALDENLDPSYLFPQIKKTGFDPSVLLDEVISMKQEEQRNELKNIFCEKIEGAFGRDPRVTLEQITAWFRRMASAGNMELDESLVAEAYDDAKRNIETKYNNIINEASSLMAKDLNKGLQYINERSDVHNILACLNKTSETLMDEAKSRALEVKKSERKNKISDMSLELKTLKNEVKYSKKTRNILICSSVVLLLLGIWGSMLCIVIAVGLGAYTFFNHKKLAEKSQHILEIQARLQELENEEVILV